MSLRNSQPAKETHMFLATPPALQDVWPDGTCYGCGPSNPRGLHIKSYWDGDDVICTFHPSPDHNAGFDNTMYGGLVASLCDCHSVWTAIAATYRHEGREHGSAPHISYVTGNLNVSYLRPTPLDQPTILRARVEELASRKAIVRCEVYAGDQKTAEAAVVAVRVPADKSIGSKHTPTEHSAK
jgi:acyl-coenzyme A thioesterase PaaI-like protein